MRGIRREDVEPVEGVVLGFDFDATYQERGKPSVAIVVRGWEPRWEPDMALLEDEDGNEWEEETGDGEWVPDVGGRVVVRMIGDDYYWAMDREDLEEIEEEDYCPECGQIGCKAYASVEE